MTILTGGLRGFRISGCSVVTRTTLGQLVEQRLERDGLGKDIDDLRLFGDVQDDGYLRGGIDARNGEGPVVDGDLGHIVEGLDPEISGRRRTLEANGRVPARGLA